MAEGKLGRLREGMVNFFTRELSAEEIKEVEEKKLRKLIKELESLLKKSKDSLSEKDLNDLSYISFIFISSKNKYPDLAEKFNLESLNKKSIETLVYRRLKDFINSPKFTTDFSQAKLVLEFMLSAVGSRVEELPFKPEEIQSLNRKILIGAMLEAMRGSKSFFERKTPLVSASDFEVSYVKDLIRLQEKYKFSAKELGIDQDEMDQIDRLTTGSVVD